MIENKYKIVIKDKLYLPAKERLFDLLMNKQMSKQK